MTSSPVEFAGREACVKQAELRLKTGKAQQLPNASGQKLPRDRPDPGPTLVVPGATRGVPIQAQLQDLRGAGTCGVLASPPRD